MGLVDKLSEIRMINNKKKKQILNSILLSIISGFLVGLFAKFFDSSSFAPSSLPSLLGTIGSQLGLWIFVATFIAVYSYTPKLASMRVFAFFVSMLFSYYMYTILFLGFFPKKQIIFWSIIALTSLPLAYIMWYSRGKGKISSFLTALPIYIILLEGYHIYLDTMEYYESYRETENILVSNFDYYYMIGTEIIYFCFIVAILFFIPENKKQSFIIIPLSIIILVISLKLNIFKILFT